MIGAAAGPVHGGVRNLLRFITDLEGRPDFEMDASGMAERLGRPPIRIEEPARAHLG